MVTVSIGKPFVSVSFSEASWTGLLDFRSGIFEERLVSRLGIPRHTLPTVMPSTAFLQGLSSKYATKWPQLVKTRLFYGIGDGAAATVGSQCMDDRYDRKGEV